MIIRYPNKKIRKKARLRQKIRTYSNLPRLSVFRSNKKIYAQIIDDVKHCTLIAANETNIKTTSKKNHTNTNQNSQSKIEKAKQVGEILAQKAIKKNITKVVFDRGAYKYHGRIKALADTARSKGLKF